MNFVGVWVIFLVSCNGSEDFIREYAFVFSVSSSVVALELKELHQAASILISRFPTDSNGFMDISRTQSRVMQIFMTNFLLQMYQKYITYM